MLLTVIPYPAIFVNHYCRRSPNPIVQKGKLRSSRSDLPRVSSLSLLQIWNVNTGQKTPPTSSCRLWAPEPHAAYLGTREGLLR